jgi:hypothetical protein
MSFPAHDAWKPWRPDEAATRLSDVGAPWCVAGGWALDLWRGQQTRPHDDLEIAILRPQFSVFRDRLREFRCFAAGSGEVDALQPDAEPPPEKHQIWILDDTAGAWRMDIFLEPGDAATWVFRRDATIRRPRADIIGRTNEGIPYLRPEGVLLYKAKATRPKDTVDFQACAPLMDPDARMW